MMKCIAKLIWDDGVWFSVVHTENGEDVCLSLESGSIDAIMYRVKYALPEMLELSFGYKGDIELSYEAERVDTIKATHDNMISSEGKIHVANIPLGDLFGDSFIVARSQAKRLYSLLSQFDEVVLDFSGIDEMGQGFAHELFVVFGNAHPNTTLKVVNANEKVRRMIKHVSAEHGRDL